MHRKRVKGLYAIAGTADISDQEPSLFLEVLDAGVSVLQYRDKGGMADERLACATAMVGFCRARGILFIVNDDIALADAVGAHGVHLGEQDDGIGVARRRLGERAVIGVSCYNSLERAERAAQAGADYLAFGRFFPSPTKPSAVHCPVDVITRAKALFELPVVAIGGITPENGQLLIGAGADSLAVISGLFSQPNPAKAATAYTRLFVE